MTQTQTNGLEVLETREWLDSLDYVLSKGGPERAGRLIQQLALHARRAAGVHLPFTATTPYQNTIPAKMQPPFPGSQEMERRIKSLVRWNALAMVMRANKIQEGIGGHISTYASLATPIHGIGGWCEPNASFEVDDSGLRRAAEANSGKIVLPDGIAFATPSGCGASNIIFTSQWNNYPQEVSVPLEGKSSHAFLLMAGSTGHCSTARSLSAGVSKPKVFRGRWLSRSAFLFRYAFKADIRGDWAFCTAKLRSPSGPTSPRVLH